MSATDPLLGEDEFKSHMDLFMQFIEIRRNQQREFKQKVDEAKANHPLRRAMDDAKKTQEEIVRQLASQKSKSEQ